MPAEFRIKSYHWWITISAALIIHSLVLLNFRQEQPQYENFSPNNNEIAISLKKLKKPVVIESKPLQAPIPPQPQVAATPPKPPVKKSRPHKPKPVMKKKPRVQTKPVTSVQKPKVAPALAKDPVTKPQVQQVPTSGKTTAAYIDEKNRYIRQLGNWLSKYKKYPTIARRRNLQGDVVVRFTIDRQGRLLRHSLVKPSPHRSLNNATIKMLERASPMPAVPAALVNNKVEFEYTIPVSFRLSSK